jgi:sucrose-6-phosphate hydrolase SacC (GH32 family)
LLGVAVLAGMIVWFGSAISAAAGWVIAAREDNDLVRVLSASGVAAERFDDPAAAVAKAAQGDGVLVLADAYPKKTTALTPALFETARAKGIRLYVEYPSTLPDLKCGVPQTLRTGQWGNILDRTVVASDAFGDRLKKSRILMIHDCHYLPVEAHRPHLVVARVAGYDQALYGLPKENVHPILFEHPGGGVLVATTKLSQFVTARYAPLDAWEPVWRMILKWAQPSADLPALRWTPPLQPSYSRDAELPADVERQALQRGAEWYRKSGLLVHPSWQGRYERPANAGPPTAHWPDGHRAGPGPGRDAAPGDGSLGLLEGFRSKIYHDGSQTVLWWRRADNHGESAGALALAGSVLQQPEFSRIGSNLADWLTGKSILYNGVFADPKHPAFGLCGWNDVPRYYGNLNGFDQLWGDDNARAWLGLLRAATALRTERYDERLAQQLLAMMRLTGNKGFIVTAGNIHKLARNGWETSFLGNQEDLSPHFQAYVQACFLWAARATGLPLLQERATKAIARMMKAYPHGWSATNDQFNQERARMLLPLAWLVRLDDTPRHREWLRRVATDLTGDMDASGAILTKISAGPASNEAYGTGETTLIQTNGDPNTDLFYTANFALVGLHEAAAATGEALYRDAEEKLVRFFCRVQVKNSAALPEFDGGWFRGFDYRRWEYWGSDADIGWSLYSMETGWIQGEVLSVLALRQMKTSFWEYTAASGIPGHFKKWRGRMLPDAIIEKANKATNPEPPAASAPKAAEPAPLATPEPDTPAMPVKPPATWLTYHLAHPAKTAPGDPNCIFFWKGRYHFHYIIEDKGGASYAHVSSTDMVHWKWHPTTLTPANMGHQMFSGTGFLTRDGKPAIIYHGSGSGRNQIAFAEDDLLEKWSKPVPVDPKTKSGALPQMRHWDPDCWLDEKTYYAVSGGRDPHLMKSSDLKNWEYLGRLLHDETPDIGVPRNEDISCPNMFQIGDKWMLLCLSHWLGCRYYLGQFKNEKYVPESHGLMNWFSEFDKGHEDVDVFAPESVLTPDGRRVMWAWSRVKERLKGVPIQSSIQSLPRELSIPKDGVLRIRPLRELETLRFDERSESNLKLESGTSYRLREISGDALEIRVVVQPGAAQQFGVRLYCDQEGNHGFPITIEPGKKSMSLGETRVPFELKAAENLDLRIFLDKNLIEVFANDRQAALAPCKYDPKNLQVILFCGEGAILVREVKGWKMRSIYDNPPPAPSLKTEN